MTQIYTFLRIICHPEHKFDILGPFHNPNYKPEDEVQNDSTSKHFF